MKKKLLFFVMTFFVVCLLTVCVSAAEVDGIYYSFTNTDAYPGYDGTATVNEENRTKGTLTEVVIPEIVEYDSDDDGVVDKKYVVTEVVGSAFGANGGSNSPVVSVFIPKTVKSIGTHVFRQLKYLETVTIEARGYNPSTKEDYTVEIKFTNAEFYYSTKLTSVDMSQSNIVELGSYCFEGDSALHTVLFSKNIKNLYSCFVGCSSLSTINSIESLENVGRGFYGTKISGDIKLPNIKTLGENAFRDTLITSVDMSGAPITNIGPRAFQNCNELTSAILPDGVTTISGYAFEGSEKLANITLPRTITSFGERAFWGPCFGGDFVFDTVTTFSNHAFRGTNIRSLVILDGTIKGENGAADQVLTSLGSDASLYGCTKLEILVLPETVTTAGSNTFTNCNSLKYIVASENFTSISSKPAKADIIIRGTDTTALQNTWTGYTVAPFSEFDPATAGTKTIYYGAVNAKDSVTTFVEFDGFDKSFSAWDATTNTETTYAPIFEAQGYSTNDEKNAIATGFSITKASLDAYKSLIGGEVNFGIVIFNPKYLSDGSFFTTNEDGAILNASGGFLMVDIGTEYSNCSLSVQGFNSGNSGIELVFAGFAYTDDITNADIFQKEYVGTSESPIASPMVSKVTRSEGTLYTTTIASVCTPVEITTGKDGLGEYTA